MFDGLIQHFQSAHLRLAFPSVLDAQAVPLRCWLLVCVELILYLVDRALHHFHGGSVLTVIEFELSPQLSFQNPTHVY